MNIKRSLTIVNSVQLLVQSFRKNSVRQLDDQITFSILDTISKFRMKEEIVTEINTIGDMYRKCECVDLVIR